MAKKKARVSEETFDGFLVEQGMLETCEERAIKEIIAEQGITKSAKAKRVKNNWRQLTRPS
jgi:hypothetical protein